MNKLAANRRGPTPGFHEVAGPGAGKGEADLIPADNKPYYRIGEVARMLGVETHVLRYWESELPQIKPMRAPSGHRLYHKSHIEMMATVQRLVHGEGLTIAGARKRLEQGPAGEAASAGSAATPGMLAAELREILKLLG